MVKHTPMDLHRQIMLYNDKLNLELDGKTVKECLNIIREKCPQLHSIEEIQEYCERNLQKILEEYDYNTLRIWYYSYKKQGLLKSFTGNDMLEEKYYKLIKEVNKFHDSLIDWIKLELDFYMYCIELEKVYNRIYGELNHYNYDLYSIIKTIKLSNYDMEVILALLPYLKNALLFENGKYYLNQNLTDKKVLEQLYLQVSEESFIDEEVYKDRHNLFYTCDGYGNFDIMGI